MLSICLNFIQVFICVYNFIWFNYTTNQGVMGKPHSCLSAFQRDTSERTKNKNLIEARERKSSLKKSKKPDEI